MTLLRPKFNEGQILSAGDLGRGVDYARYADAVHCRTQHTWGVVVGLSFRTVDQATADGQPYQDVHLTPGIAIDPSGRRIVVDTETILSTAQFKNLGVAGANEPNALYPVYILAVDQPQAAQTGGACAATSPTRVAETFQIDFGRPGSETKALEPAPVGFGAGPSAGTPVLVGYVQFDAARGGGQFLAVAAASPTGQVKYAGVRAAEVIAPAGSVVLHTQESGKRFALSLAEKPGGACELRFGSRQGDGQISDTFVVNEKGDVTVSGKWDVKLPPGPVASSGVIYNGLRVPLPAGITEAAVTSRQIDAHVVVSPIALGIQGNYYPVQLECSVDDHRRVVSTVMWRHLTDPTDYKVRPAPCQYVMVAAPAS